jgi:hypothetical protein
MSFHHKTYSTCIVPNYQMLDFIVFLENSRKMFHENIFCPPQKTLFRSLFFAWKTSCLAGKEKLLLEYDILFICKSAVCIKYFSILILKPSESQNCRMPVKLRLFF